MTFFKLNRASRPFYTCRQRPENCFDALFRKNDAYESFSKAPKVDCLFVARYS